MYNEVNIEIEKTFLFELRTGIMQAIGHEDGLDGLDGERLLAKIDSLLAEDKNNKIEWEIRAIKNLILIELKTGNIEWLAVASLAGEAYRITKKKEESK